MTTWYVNPLTGNDANGGSSWGDAKKRMGSIPTASVAAGDEVRIAKTSDPVSIGDATWTDGSVTVTLAAPVPGLTLNHLISRATLAYWDPEPWYGIAAISGATVTLRRKYRGTSGSHATNSRETAKPGTGAVVVGWGTTGGTFKHGTTGSRITVSGGWNTASGLRDGQTVIDGAGTCLVRLCGDHTDLSRISTVRNPQDLQGYVGRYCVWEIDNALETTGDGVVVGSGIFTYPTTLRANVLAGNSAAALHIHTSYNVRCELGRVLDNGSGSSSAIIQNNDWFGPDATNSNTTIIAQEIAWSPRNGIGEFWFPGGCSFDIDSLHDNATGGIGVGTLLNQPEEEPWDGSPTTHSDLVTFRIGDAWNNGTDIQLGTSSASYLRGTATIIASTLRSTTGISATQPDTILDIRPITASAAVDGATAVLSGLRKITKTVTVDCATATVGSVSYPTDYSWSATATGLAAGVNTFVVGDGTDTVNEVVDLTPTTTTTTTTTTTSTTTTTTTTTTAAPTTTTSTTTTAAPTTTTSTAAPTTTTTTTAAPTTTTTRAPGLRSVGFLGLAWLVPDPSGALRIKLDSGEIVGVALDDVTDETPVRVSTSRGLKGARDLQ